jgi:hypothetical protein
LDKYIKLKNPTEDPVATGIVVKRIKESEDLKRYFFGQNPTPGWAEILYSNGLFGSPPNVIRTEGGYKTPPWYLSSYLANVASEVPSIVNSVINELQTDNPIIHADLINALTKIPPSKAADHTRKVINWLDNKFTGWGIAEATSRLTLNLAENGYIAESMKILNAMISPLPGEARKSDETYWGGEAKFKHDLSYLKPDFWGNILPRLGEIDPKESINVLEKNLLLAIRFEILAKNREYSSDDWLTYGWRSSIGDSAQDSRDDYKDRILISLRNILDSWIVKEPENTRFVIEDYLNREEVILTRIAIYLVAIHSSVYPDLSRALLREKSLHSNLKVHNEYFRLLANAFPSLSLDDRESVLSIILEGPDPQRVEMLANNLAIRGVEDRDEYIKRYKESWIRDRLWVIQNSLPEEINLQLLEYCERYGTPEHPGFLSWSSGGYTIAEISPLPEEDIANLSPENLLEYLKTWKPDPNQQFGPEQVSLRGLSDTVASLLLKFPEQYNALFKRLPEAPPAISASLFFLAREHCKKKVNVPWKQLLDLAYATAEVIFSREQFNWDEGNFEARIAAIQFVKEALSVRDLLPSEYLSDIETIVSLYLQDPDPDENRDSPPEGWVGHGDPITLALNSIRPIALMCLMLILSIRLNHSENRSFKGELLTPDIKATLESKLDRSKDSSWAVHSVFGQYVWLLTEIDWEWFQALIPLIFPTEATDELVRYFNAAWEAYVILNNPSRELFDALLPQYLYAIHLLSQGKTTKTHLDYVSRMSDHLINDYFWSPYELVGEHSETKPLVLLFSLCGQDIRSRVIWTLWRMAKRIPPKDMKKYWAQIKAIWKWRINEASLSRYPHEFKDEMEELSHLPTIAPVSESIDSLWPYLEPMVPYSGDYRVWRNLEEFLSERVEVSPYKAIRFYLYMHEKAPKPDFGYHHYGEESDKIVYSAARNMSSRKVALKVMDIIFRRGDDRYRDLYEEFT